MLMAQFVELQYTEHDSVKYDSIKEATADRCNPATVRMALYQSMVWLTMATLCEGNHVNVHDTTLYSTPFVQNSTPFVQNSTPFVQSIHRRNLYYWNNGQMHAMTIRN